MRVTSEYIGDYYCPQALVNTEGITSALQVFWDEIGYLMERETVTAKHRRTIKSDRTRQSFRIADDSAPVAVAARGRRAENGHGIRY
ncbi:hypothetical protein EVAR_57132_1 [Eumeta japonica]|uniref:Uncharacterized protein n=1 Tax=Eumeta variegata TaxID=151549 RepID=A0A4C1YPU7_EUMVA|nr:hypothetical protein EVAR_57132_1 [Eumeta japonica]